MDQLQKIVQTLQTSGFKLTPQRKAIVQAILEKKREHLNAEEIFNYAKKCCHNLGLATVYRMMAILSELNIVNCISFQENGSILYDLNQEESLHFHSHLYCQKCSQIIEVKEDLLKEVEALVQSKFSFLINDHRLIFHGLCYKCQEK
ncbi:MAG: transcriptional repressor [Streptococcaceae bacterium]|jgi:Fur family ferric uptake transcriptional regulator|nr:transcriptional repressor [Streptococcaceae bacterium]